MVGRAGFSEIPLPSFITHHLSDPKRADLCELAYASLSVSRETEPVGINMGMGIGTDIT